MKKQEYILEKQKSFEVKHIFECGQCFRWNQQKDGSYIGVVKQGVIQVKQQGEEIRFCGICSEDLKSIVTRYFDLNNDYEHIKQSLSQIDDFMKTSTNFGKGIRILQQDLWECIISFIISANNNIPRIKKIIERISKEYGAKLEFEGKEYYLFPTPKELAKATQEDLRRCGLGFRDKRVFHTTKMILEKEVNLQQIERLDSTEQMRQELLKLEGVGPKVADCILLFALKRFDVFPMDVWVRRVMNELYLHQENEEKVKPKIVNQLASEKFQGMAGLAPQYLFYWKRETS